MDATNSEIARRALDGLRELGAEAPVRFPAQPPVGSVLRFQRTYDRRASGPKTYDYIAIRSEIGWHVTGRENGVLTFDELVGKIGDGECLLVTEYVEIPHLPRNPLDDIESPREWFGAVFGESSQAASDE